MMVSDFLSRHPDQDLASPNKIIPISFQNRELLNNTDIFCPAKMPPTPVMRVTRRTAQAGEVASIWPLTGETRKPEHVTQQQPTQRQRQPEKPVMHGEVHASIEPPEPEIPIESQVPDEALDQVGYPPTPEDPVEQETEVSEPLNLCIVSPQPRPMALEQPLPQVLSMPRPMPFPDTLPKVSNQPFPYQGLIKPSPLDIRLLCTLPGYDNGIDT